MINRSNDREIDLRGLLARSVNKWKTILLWGVIFSILMIGLTLFKQKREYNSLVNSFDNSEVESIDEELQDLLNNQYYSNAGRIERINEIINSKKEYYAESLLTPINPAGTYVAPAYLSIRIPDDNAEFELINEQKFSHDLVDFIESQIVWDELAADLDTEPMYLQELVRDWVDVNSAVITINVIGSSAEQAERVMDYILIQIEKEGNRIKPQEAEFSIKKCETIVTNDSTLASWHYNKTKEINDIEALRDKLKTVTEDKVTPTSISKFSIDKKKIVKYSVVGFFGGILICLLFMILFMSLDDIVLSTEEAGKYINIDQLGRIETNMADKVSKLSKFISGDKFYKQPEDVSLEIAYKRIEKSIKDMKNIVLAGDVSKESINEIANILNVKFNGSKHFVCVEDINRDVDTIKLVENSDGLILVSQVWHSKYKKIEEIINTAEVLDKTVCGILTF